jgi:class 3 adenylate cyclase
LNKTLSAIGLRFQDGAVEAQFRRDFATAVLPIQRGALVVALAIMLLFTVRDVQLTGVYGTFPLFFRLFVILPVLAISLWLTFQPFVVRHHQLFFFALATLLVVIVISQIFLIPPSANYDARSGFRAMTTMTLVVGVVALSGLRFEFAPIVGLLAIVGWLVNAHVMALDETLWRATVLHLVAIYALSCCVNFWIERLLRQQFTARQSLVVERARSDELLRSAMPAHAAERLKRGEQNIADAFIDSAVLFTDLVGFTDLSKRIGPKETVRVLDHVFSRFDEIVAVHGLDRVKTMGDGYLAIGGTGETRGGAHEAAKAACAMIAAVERASAEFGMPLALRVGLHVGPVIGGVVGDKRPTYDYWGDTLNIASRLETTSVPGRVHCSEAAYWRLGKAWRFERRSAVELEGYATVQSYLLTGPADR